MKVKEGGIMVLWNRAWFLLLFSNIMICFENYSLFLLDVYRFSIFFSSLFFLIL